MNLAKKHSSTGNFEEGKRLEEESAAIYKEALGEKHPLYAQTLQNLAVSWFQLGNYARAEPLYRQALAIEREVFGEQHPEYAVTLASLASLYADMGDRAKATPLYERAAAIHKAAVGEKHPQYATAITHLAATYAELQEYERAEALLREALAIRKEVLGVKHPEYGQTLNRLGMLYKDKAEYARAVAIYKEALDIYRESIGEAHPSYAAILNNLAGLYSEMRENAKSEELYRESLAIKARSLGEEHPDYLISLNGLVWSLFYQRKYEEADRRSREVLAKYRQYVARMGTVQSERQQLESASLFRHVIAGHLARTSASQAPAEEVYQEICTWKGAVWAHQQAVRRQRRAIENSSDAAVKELFHKLEAATRALASLSRADQKTFGTQQRASLERLSEEVESLQIELSRRAPISEASRELDPARVVNEIKRGLPPEAVLIDLYEHRRYQPEENGKEGVWEDRLVAFLLRADRAIERIELGTTGPIVAAINTWREGLGGGSSAIGAGANLRRLVWKPLEEAVKGAKIILISPDGAAARFPWAAIPGEKPGSYLIETHAVAMVPVPTLLPELIRSREADAREDSLLLVGDVDFETSSGATSSAVSRGAAQLTRGEAGQAWTPLPGTGVEVDAVEKLFPMQTQQSAVAKLRRSEATEEAIRRAAAGRRYLHFATHGYFAPPQVRSAIKSASQTGGEQTGSLFGQKDLGGYHPGLLSGLVLAGAGQPIDPDRDDGILTALEVSEMDLAQAQLAVLSACETGLGETAGGEGLLGLQRAFQIAGAQTVAASLWSVPDQATKMLMVRFYENLWKKKMGKLEALREAQLWMLEKGAEQPEMRRELAARGLKEYEGDRKQGTGGRLPVYFWGAWVLSGDWR